jgi:hypothetical protein
VPPLDGPGDVTPAAPGLSARLLTATRAGDDAEARRLRVILAELTPRALAAQLPDDATRIATWLNLYNATAQQLIAADAAAYARRTRFFRRRALTVAGTALSLDAVEHGLLRRSRVSIGMGWLANPLPGGFERRLRVDRIDARIHFALNCAAASCPPIAAYGPIELDAQLDRATRGYLGASVRLEQGRLIVPRVFLWYIGDFGGPAGVRRFLARHGVRGAGRPLRFDRWDWTPAAGAWLPADAGGVAGR